ncbi:MarR family winged helix-turn-helix transcriptional regulator [Ammoniphilus sp. YIM 78166]|uniref:MarR family winged helix-turn-helix transcriptional regulator n=1 Tax=Ammoniphilus sp. YIM 78166 TaxID=1644106 RepID=UPI00106F11F4|nr:MarR family transcriptional regulator [Ammoniphilus sp. YIM 78166]
MKLDDSLGYLISNTGRKLSNVLTNQFTRYNITTEQWTLLNRLVEWEGISQKDLASQTEKDPANVTRILDQLERKGLAVRRLNPNDRRSFLIYATSKGEELNHRLIPIEEQTVQRLLKGLSEQQVQMLKETLNQIAENANTMMRVQSIHQEKKKNDTTNTVEP